MAKKLKVAAIDPAVILDKQAKKWAAKAPAIHGLRRPGTRMKAIALMQKMEARGVLNANAKATVKNVGDMADFIADIDELLATLGGEEYVEFIEQVPMADGLQIAVLLEVFSSKIAPDLGKG